VAAAPARKPKALDATDYRILEACVRNPDASQKAIGEALGISLRTINKRLQNPQLREALAAKYAEAVDTAVKIYRAYAPVVARRLVKVLQSPTAEDRDVVNAAREMNRILESKSVTVNFGNPLAVEHTVDLETLTDEELAFFKAILERKAASKSAAEGART
jgi:DNA-binding Lrp family transcriptional regulator